MKSYTITVNGNVYDVTVEEKSEAGVAAAPAAAPKAAPKAPKAPAPKRHRVQEASVWKQEQPEKYLKSKLL